MKIIERWTCNRENTYVWHTSVAGAKMVYYSKALYICRFLHKRGSNETESFTDYHESLIAQSRTRGNIVVANFLDFCFIALISLYSNNQQWNFVLYFCATKLKNLFPLLFNYLFSPIELTFELWLSYTSSRNAVPNHRRVSCNTL